MDMNTHVFCTRNCFFSAKLIGDSLSNKNQTNV